MTTLAITKTVMNNYATITFIIDNLYSKTEVDPSLSNCITSTRIDASYYTKSEIDTTLNLYPPTARIVSSFYSKLYIDNTFISSTQTGTLYDNKTETDDMSLSYSTGSYVDYNFYTKTETDTLLTDKLTNIGDTDLPGMLDIGTSGYTNSSIRCIADVNGYIGYAELRAASSYDMYLNLSTTRTDGGWMYVKIYNDDHMDSPGSDSKVEIYKDTSISGNLDVGSVTIDAGSYTMGKLSVGDTTAYESFNGNVNGFDLNPQTHEFCCLC